MIFGGIVCILVAIWIYRTAVEAKIPNPYYWVIASVAVYLAVQLGMIGVNAAIIDFFTTDVSSAYDSAGGLNARDNSDAAGLQTGKGGTFIGIIFELLPWVFPFLTVAILRVLFMLKTKITLTNLFSGIKEMFGSIIKSFKNPQ